MCVCVGYINSTPTSLRKLMRIKLTLIGAKLAVGKRENSRDASMCGYAPPSTGSSGPWYFTMLSIIVTELMVYTSVSSCKMLQSCQTR